MECFIEKFRQISGVNELPAWGMHSTISTGNALLAPKRAELFLPCAPRWWRPRHISCLFLSPQICIWPFSVSGKMGCKRKKGSRSLDDHEFQNDRWFWGWWRCSVLLWVLLRPTMFPKPMLDYLHISSHDDKCGSYHEIRMSQGELLISNKSTGIGLVCRAKCSQNASIRKQWIPILGGEVVGFANKWEDITWTHEIQFCSFIASQSCLIVAPCFELGLESAIKSALMAS